MQGFCPAQAAKLSPSQTVSKMKLTQMVFKLLSFAFELQCILGLHLGHVGDDHDDYDVISTFNGLSGIQCSLRCATSPVKCDAIASAAKGNEVGICKLLRFASAIVIPLAPPERLEKGNTGAKITVFEPNMDPPPFDGDWGDWSAWTGSCTSPCNPGMKERTRACDSPAPLHFGADCVGTNNESCVCGTLDCGISPKANSTVSVNSGDGAVLDCTAACTPDGCVPDYSWNFGGDTTATLTLRHVMAVSHGFVYTCTASHPYDTTISSSTAFSMIVQDLTPPPHAVRYMNTGDTAVFNCTATCGPNPCTPTSYSWGLAPDSTNRILTTAVTAGNFYSCTISHPADNSFTATVNFRVRVPDSDCSGEFTASTGTFTSPGYPSEYPKNKLCAWRITVAVGQRVMLQFAAERQEHCRNCYCDSLTVYDGLHSYSPTLGEYCTTSIPPSILSSSNEFLAVLDIGSRGSDIGFSASYASTTSVFTTIATSYLFSGETADLDCTTYCGQTTCTYSWNDGSGSTDATLTTAAINGDVEFTCTVSHQDAFSLLTGINFKILVFDSDCSAEVTASTGTITTPNYPSDYPHHKLCAWRFTLPVGQRVGLYFTFFELESESTCKYDDVTIYDGPRAVSPKIGKYCSTIVPTHVMSSSNQLLVVFKTDNSVVEGGFSATHMSILAV